MQPLRRIDEDRTQIIEGAAKGVPLWSHMTRVEPCGEYGAVCVDQVEISAGALTPAVMRAAEIYLKAVQKSRNRQMRKEGRIIKKSETDALFPIFLRNLFIYLLNVQLLWIIITSV